MGSGRSLFWPSVFAGGAFLVLLGLGTWQVERLFWKEGLIAQRHAAVTAAPTDLPPSLEAAQLLEYHRVQVTGRLANDRELYLGATSPDGRAGYHEVTVTGLLRLPPSGKPHWFIPANNAERNYWLYVDVPAMAAAAHLDRVLPFYIDADATPNPGGLPVGGQTLLDLPNDHLQYAFTWYALAAGLAIIYILFIRRRAQGEPA